MTSPSYRILLIEDELPMRRFLRAGFELEPCLVEEAADAGAGIRLATLKPFDLIVLDLGLPDLDGKQVIERIRAWSEIPIIALSVRAQEEEKVAVLDLGADDYVVKPFGMAELLARGRSALRRRKLGATPAPVVISGRLAIDLANRRVELAGEPLQLTPKEYSLLQMLAQNAGKVVTHQHLLREIWGTAHAEDSHYLRIVVRKIRQKIEIDSTRPEILLTELGVGYRLAVPREPLVNLAERETEQAAPQPSGAVATGDALP